MSRCDPLALAMFWGLLLLALIAWVNSEFKVRQMQPKEKVIETRGPTLYDI